MRCAEVKRLLGRYVDKEIADKKIILLIEEHLNKCYHCKTELESLISARELLLSKQRLRLDDDFLIRIKDKLLPDTLNIKLRWILEAGSLAKRLIPVPVGIIILTIILMFGRHNNTMAVDNYMFGDLTNEEIGILNGHIGTNDLLREIL